MSKYTTADFIVYMKMMMVLAVVLFAMSLLCFRYLGGSIGKWVSGYKTVRIDGSALTWRLVIARTLIQFALGILIISPGPLIGYFFGNGSEIASLAVLILAFGLWLVFVAQRPSVRKDNELAQTRLEKFLDIKTVQTNTQSQASSVS
jgi:uncharacterized RDD family membrane protein YckC